MNKPLPVSLPQTRVSREDPAAPASSENVAKKRPYGAPLMVEYGNVRDLTKGSGTQGKDKNGSRRAGNPN
jgi:hypothetical protein